MLDSEGVTQELPSITIQPIHQLLHCNYNIQTLLGYKTVLQCRSISVIFYLC